MSTRHNRLTFDHARTLTEGAIGELPVDDIIALQDDLAQRAEAINLDNVFFAAIVARRFAGMADSAYKAEQKDTGKVTVSIDKRFDLVGKKSKTVTWNQDQLAALYARIEQSGDNPEIYIKRNVATTYTVPEAVFKSWPENIKAIFVGARAVTAGDIQISIQPKKGTT